MALIHTHYTLKSLVGTLEVPRGVRQMNGVPQSGADRSDTAESRVRTYWSNRFTVNYGPSNVSKNLELIGWNIWFNPIFIDLRSPKNLFG